MRRHAGFLVLALLAVPFSARAAEGPARLLRDLNEVLSEDRGSYPGGFTRLGSQMLFRAQTHATGFELWRTDGTPEGTCLVKDVWPGPYSGLDWPSSIGRPIGFVEVNGVLLFPADDGVHGLELWRTDGTAEGTFLLEDIVPGPSGGLFDRYGPDPREVVWLQGISAGAMYFLADDGVHGFELWRTDGTAAGTFQLQDIQPGSGSAFGGYGYYSLEGVAFGEGFYFRAANDESGAELWRNDGTAGGTEMVVDHQLGPGSASPSGMTVLGDSLIYSAAGAGYDAELWRSDGTAEGTVLLGDLFPGSFGSGPRQLTRVGDLVYFQVFQHLYRTDGTAEGTIRLHSFYQGSMQFYGEIGGRLLLRSDDGDHGEEPWLSDGTPEGTVLLKDIRPTPGYSWFQDLAHVAGIAYLLADDGVHGQEIWRSDGTEGGTRLVADLTPGPEGTFVWSAVPWQGGVLFRTSDGLYTIDAVGALTKLATLEGSGDLAVLGNRAIFDGHDALLGFEPWSTDGTPEGTGLLRDVNPLLRNNGSHPAFVGSVLSPDGKARGLFAAYGGTRSELWATDGTSGGTEKLREITLFRGPGASLGGSVYFAADDGVHGWELWRSDGTPAGTAMAQDLLPGQWGGILSTPVAYRDRVYFMAEDEAHGAELWSSDGTDAGTGLLRDIAPGPDWSYVSSLVVAGDTLFFTATDGHGRELWRTDGTEEGTTLVKDIAQGFSGNCCGTMTPLGGRLLMRANDGVHGDEPWMSDGTEAGTFLLKDVVAGSGSSFSGEVVVAGESAYFSTSDGLHGHELWRTDGTEAGTFQVADVRPGPDSSFPNFLGAIGDTVAFMIRPGSSEASDLWRSDGSEAGTQAVGAAFAYAPRAAGAFDLGVLFTEIDDTHGLELWRTDGTAAGTAFVQDVAPGPAWSQASDFVRLGTRILFVADDPTAGVELFTGRAALLLGRPAEALRDLRQETSALALPRGLASSLLAKLAAAEAALAAGRSDQAAHALENFARHAEGQAPADLVEFARDLEQLLGDRHQ